MSQEVQLSPATSNFSYWHPAIQPSGDDHPTIGNSNLVERSAQVPDIGVSVGPDPDNRQALVRVRKGSNDSLDVTAGSGPEQVAAHVEYITRTGLSEYERHLAEWVSARSQALAASEELVAERPPGRPLGASPAAPGADPRA